MNAVHFPISSLTRSEEARLYGAPDAETFADVQARYAASLTGEDLTEELSGTPADSIALLLTCGGTDEQIGRVVRAVVAARDHRLAVREYGPQSRMPTVSAEQAAVAVMEGLKS